MREYVFSSILNVFSEDLVKWMVIFFKEVNNEVILFFYVDMLVFFFVVYFNIGFGF